MKYLLTTFLLFLFAQFNVNAQRNTVFEPIQPDAGYTPYQRNVPFEFQFLVDDELTKVLFNPSNLALIDSNQFYITLEPGSNRNYRFAYLSANGWALNGSFRDNSTENYNVTQFQSDERDSSVIGSFLRESLETSQELREQDGFQSLHEGQLQLTRLLSLSGEAARSISLDLSYLYNSNKQDGYQISDRNIYRQDFENDTLTSILNDSRRETYLSNLVSEQLKIKAGITYAYYSGNIRAVHRLYGMYGNIESINNSTDLYLRIQQRQDFEIDTTINSTNTSELMNNTNLNSSPWLIGYKGYLNRKMGWIGEDFIFGIIDTYIGSAGKNMSIDFSRENTETDNSGTINSIPFNDDLSKSNAKEYLANGSVSFGYAVRKQMNDLTLFSGISQTYQYIQQEGYEWNRNTGILSFDDSFHTLLTRIPFFGEYKVNEWVSFFGGGTINLIYTSNLSKVKTDTPSEITEINYLDYYSVRSSRSRYQENTNTYFGLRAHHKSGLKLIADINGDLAQLSGWRFTLGYQF